jgi:hypothetical protein
LASINLPQFETGRDSILFLMRTETASFVVLPAPSGDPEVAWANIEDERGDDPGRLPIS